MTPVRHLFALTATLLKTLLFAARLDPSGDRVRLPRMDEKQTERIELLLQLIADELLVARMERISEMSISRGREDHVGQNIPAAVGDINKLRAKIRALQKS
jgi:hypothetical protein